MERFINSIKQKLSKVPIVISGTPIKNYKKEVPENVFLKRSIQEVIEYVNSF
jgi:hypothetical protein